VLVEITSLCRHVAAEFTRKPDSVVFVLLVLGDEGLACCCVRALVAVVEDAFVLGLLVPLNEALLGGREVAEVAAEPDTVVLGSLMFAERTWR